MGNFKLGTRVIVEDKEYGKTIIGTVIAKTTGTMPDYLVKADSVGEHESGYFHDGNDIPLKWGIPSNKMDSRFFYDTDMMPLPVKEGEKKPETTMTVRRFPSGAIRSDDRGREKPSFISPYALTEIAKHFSANAHLFDDADSGKNYMKGIKPTDIQDSLLRHGLELQVALLPNKYSRDDAKEALKGIAANCIMALHQIVMEEKGEYKEVYDKIEYVEKG